MCGYEYNAGWGYNSNRIGNHFHSDLQGVRRHSTMKGLGGGGGVGLTYMRIYRVGQRGGSVCVYVCVEGCGRSEKRVDDGCE